MEMFPGNDAEFWRETWKKAVQTSPMTARLIRTEDERIKRWDKMARLFSGKKRPTGNKAAEDDIIRRLMDSGALKPGIRVLDIGAGLGSLTLRIAEVADHVTALEPSGAMADVIEETCLERGIKNVAVDRRKWSEMDVKNQDASMPFDLVVSSMNPGIGGPEDLEKMNRFSCGFCYLSWFSGLHGFYGFDGIWEMFFNEDPGPDPLDIIFPFNLLYNLGYRPSMEFIVRDQPPEVDMEEVRKRISASLWNYMDETPAVLKAVDDFLKARSKDGLVKFDKGFCQGRMIWRTCDS